MAPELGTARTALKWAGVLGLVFGAAGYLFGAGRPHVDPPGDADLIRPRPSFRASQRLLSSAQGGRIAAVGQEDFEVVKLFDKDGNGRLDAGERQLAREYVEGTGLGRSRGRRGDWGYTPEPGPRVQPGDVRPYPTTGLFDTGALRTLFLTFENGDWERGLMAFKPTDVDVPATLMVDGREYQDVGVQFHGNSSFMGVPAGFKHSMRLSLDFAHESQELLGQRTLLLLNAHEDPSFVRTILAMMVAGDYYPAPKANFVRVVINGESWGIYVNQQHFNKDMTRDLFKTGGGSRWRVHGTRGGYGGGLSYLGEDEAAYRQVYDLRAGDSSEAWAALKRLTKVLAQTPADQLEAALAPMLDVDATLRFLAVENAIVNSDGYWTKASDYNLYLDPSGRFHLLPYDVNGTFASGYGPAGSRTGSVWLGPLDATADPDKPLLSKLLASPALRSRYLSYVRDVADRWLDWNRLGPTVSRLQAMIAADVRKDTRKLVSDQEFEASAEELRGFVQQRREVVLKATAGTGN